MTLCLANDITATKCNIVRTIPQVRCKANVVVSTPTNSFSGNIEKVLVQMSTLNIWRCIYGSWEIACIQENEMCKNIICFSSLSSDIHWSLHFPQGFAWVWVSVPQKIGLRFQAQFLFWLEAEVLIKKLRLTLLCSWS